MLRVGRSARLFSPAARSSSRSVSGARASGHSHRRAAGARWFGSTLGVADESEGKDASVSAGAQLNDEWPKVGSEIPIALNKDDEKPTVRTADEGYYPDWLASVADTLPTQAALEKEFEASVSTNEETGEQTSSMPIERLSRAIKLESRAKIKEKNESSNML